MEIQENWIGLRSGKVEHSDVLTLVMLNDLKEAMLTSNFQPIKLLHLDCWHKFTYLMANSADSDQLASSEAN